MDLLLRHLHSVIVMGALVAIFVALQRKHPSPRVRYWMAGWGLMFLHFCLRVLPVAGGTTTAQLAAAADAACLITAGILFLISVARVFGDAVLRRWLLVLLLAPALAYSVLLGWEVASPWPAMLCLAVLAYGGAAWYLARYRPTPYIVTMVAVFIAAGTWAIYRVWKGGAEYGFLVALTVLYAMTGVLFWRHYRRFSPGVVTTAVGFLLWSGVWAGAAAVPHLIARAGYDSELWNIPKLLVAFGMIVTLLENQSLAAEEAGERARQAGIQIQRFADVTSRLLSGADARSLCGHVAQVIAATTAFQRAAIYLADDQRQVSLAGHAGLAPEALRQLEEAPLTVDGIAERCAAGRRVAQNSFLCDGDALLVPLRSPRGMLVGCISLDHPRDVTGILPEELSKLEMLAADLAVAIENATLQRQLVVSEKLAAVGQLVAGVAHELNNPLTAVMGYAEVLSEHAADERTRRDLGIIHREGVRMKRIIENLLRFARKNKPERRTISLLPLLDEVLRLRAYEVRGQGVQVVTRVPATLPKVSGDENQLKQAFFNVLSNAIDAVEDAPEKRITIEGRVQGDRVLISFTDSGAGFSEPDRVFDPFFTTKSPGKGTGLGLSICYGILKDHGGDIYAYNVHPAGACVALELPIAAEEFAKAAAE
jgi:signal transduction histidine kinase